MKISTVIPVYNEFQNIRQVLARVAAASLPSGCTKEMIVVDDGSVARMCCLAGISDEATAYKAFRTDVLRTYCPAV